MTNTYYGPNARIDRQRFEEACDWFLQLREAPESSDLVAAWLAWSRADSRNPIAFEEARALWWITRTVQGRLIKDDARTQSPKAVPNTSAAARTRWLAAAAAFVAIVMGAVWALRFAPSRVNHPLVVSTFVTAQREHRSFHLPDGSSIEVAGDSQLTASLYRDRRQIELDRGEAYFRVARDAARPFTVTAGATHVTAVGTSFNVRAGHDLVVIAVEEGVVVVEPTASEIGARRPVPLSDSTAQHPIRLRKGQEASVGVKTHELQVMSIEPDAVASWREGRLRFSREPLRSVVASVLASSGQTITLADPSLGELRFTGTVFSARVEDWVQGLPQIFPVSVHQEGKTFVVSRRQ